MKNQTAFNKVWKHFVVERNRPAINKKNSCVYRGPRGAKCAFGIFIPDHLYKKEFEHHIVETLFQAFPELAKHIHINREFAQKLQNCHDNAAQGSENFHETIKIKLETLASTEGLTIPKKGR
jgi:hypothetical protein